MEWPPRSHVFESNDFPCVRGRRGGLENNSWQDVNQFHRRVEAVNYGML